MGPVYTIVKDVNIGLVCRRFNKIDVGPVYTKFNEAEIGLIFSSQ